MNIMPSYNYDEKRQPQKKQINKQTNPRIYKQAT